MFVQTAWGRHQTSGFWGEATEPEQVCPNDLSKQQNLKPSPAWFSCPHTSIYHHFRHQQVPTVAPWCWQKHKTCGNVSPWEEKGRSGQGPIATKSNLTAVF